MITLTRNERLNNLINICVDNMRQWGYLYNGNIKFTLVEPRRYLGQCKYPKNGNPMTIKISKAVLAAADDETVSSVIYHELIHAYCPVGTHHGGLWKQIAQSVSDKTGLNISRTTNTAVLGANYAMQFPYVFRCKKCGKIFGVARRTRFVQNYNKKDRNGELMYWHACDHGELERIK